MSVVSRLQGEQLVNQCLTVSRIKEFFPFASKLGLGSIQPLCQWLLGTLSRGRGEKKTMVEAHHSTTTHVED